MAAGAAAGAGGVAGELIELTMTESIEILQGKIEMIRHWIKSQWEIEDGKEHS